MSSTLIVRDATLAINGAPESRREPGEHLRDRLQEVTRFDPGEVDEYVETLSPSVTAEEVDPEVLEALVLLGLGHPEIIPKLGISPVLAGRRLASHLERASKVQHALALLEFLVEEHPGQRALERDLAALMRRQGMMQDLVDRYLDRAKKLLRQKRTSEAIAWLREILLLDRSRKDVARMIRDLRFEEVDQSKDQKKRVRRMLFILAASLLMALGVLREMHVKRLYGELPSSTDGNLASMSARLEAVEVFMEAHPLWHGMLTVLEERSQLRVDVTTLEEDARVAEHAVRKNLEQRIEAAELARARGLLHAEAREFKQAGEEFRRSLELATEDWPARARVERDIEAIAQYIEEESGQ